MFTNSSFYWPLTQNRIRQSKLNHTFGYVRNGGTKGHWGWDFYASPGTPCYAICQGKIVDVTGSASETTSFGLTVVLEFQHEGKTLYAAYCHLAGSSVVKGAPVDAGQQIGFTGNSGNAFNMAPEDQHLHFELRTKPRPGPGGPPSRIDPIEIFNVCPLDQTFFENYEWAMK